MPEDTSATRAWVKGLLKRNDHQSWACPRHDQDRAASGLPLDERTLRGLIRGTLSGEPPLCDESAGESLPYRRIPPCYDSRLFPPQPILSAGTCQTRVHSPIFAIRSSTSALLIFKTLFADYFMVWPFPVTSDVA